MVALPGQVDTRISAVEKDLTHQVSTAIFDANNRINGALTIVDQRTDQALKIVDDRSGGIVNLATSGVGSAEKVATQAEADLNARLVDTNKILADTAKPVADVASTYAALPNQIAQDRVFKAYVDNGLGLIAATKLTMGQAAKMSKTIDDATPTFIATWNEIGTHVDFATDQAGKASEATAHTMENFAASSKPLPTWARILLGVGPPVAQMGAAAASAGQVLGWIK